MEWTSLLYFAYAILGIGIIIFIHELGHFLAAKRVGVRVETFCLGFDPTIRGRRLRLLSFRRGDTVYAIGAIPFGGYVKMAGESVLDRKDQAAQPPRSDELVSKPPGARALVFAAGAAFNIISAFIFFIIAFWNGVSFIAPVVGQAEPGRPAWRAGLRSGDQVEAIDGEAVTDFNEIAIACALGEPDRPHLFRLRRGDQELDVKIVPRWAPEYGFHTIGITPAIDPEIKEVAPDSAAARAGIRKGDRLAGLKLEGVTISGPGALTFWQEYLTLRPGAEFQVGVERPGTSDTQWIPVRLQKKPTPKPAPLLGVMAVQNVLEAIRPRSPAERFLAPGDRVVKAGGQPLASLDWLETARTLGTSGPVSLDIEALSGETHQVTLDAQQLIAWSVDRDLKWGNQRARVYEVDPGSPFARVLLPDDVVIAVGPNRTPVFDPDDFHGALAAAQGPLTVWWRRGQKVLRAEVVVPPGTKDEGLEWNKMPPVRVLPGSAAARAGISSGSRILEINGRPIRSWDDLTAAVKAAGPGEARVTWVPPEGDPSAPKQSVLESLLSTEGPENYEDLGLGMRQREVRVQAGIFESFGLGARRTLVVAENVYLTLKGLLSRQVSASNLAGPVGIIHLIYHVSEHGIGTLIYYLALISVNLGLFNLLPFPILDGGHLLFLAIEKIKGSPVDVRVQEIATTVAFFLIIGLALFVTFNDLQRLFGR